METPAVKIDLVKVDANIAGTQKIFDDLGVAFRPHIKTHRIPEFAQRQLDAGAIGITCQKIGEADVMADSGIDDILITYNILGDEKLARLVALAGRCTLSVTADNDTVVDGLSKAFANAPGELEVLVECDTGQGRCGVQSPEDAAALATTIDQAPGLQFGGLMTYPPMADMKAVDQWLRAAKAACEAAGLACPRVSNGGTPNLARVDQVTIATEHRAGTYIYNDRSLVNAGACQLEQCALTVVATVVSRPTADRAIIDAGSKALTSDLLGMEGHGHIVGAPDAVIGGLSEEHGHVDLSGSDWQPGVGDVIEIIPNHACVVSNLVDEVHVVDENNQIRLVKVAARGCSQ